jgi:hypothetical protein
MGSNMKGTNPDPNGGEFQGADRDPNLTRAIEDGPPTGQEITNDVTTGKSGSTTLGNVREVYAVDKLAELEVEFDNGDVEPPGHSPNSWVGDTDDEGIFRSADPYRNQGLSGPSPDREYLENQG